jgi:hypothetical protein
MAAPPDPPPPHPPSPLSPAGRAEQETFGAMAKSEKIAYILEQVRLCLDRKDFVRAQVGGLVRREECGQRGWASLPLACNLVLQWWCGCWVCGDAVGQVRCGRESRGLEVRVGGWCGGGAARSPSVPTVGV